MARRPPSDYRRLPTSTYEREGMMRAIFIGPPSHAVSSRELVYWVAAADYTPGGQPVDNVPDGPNNQGPRRVSVGRCSGCCERRSRPSRPVRSRSHPDTADYLEAHGLAFPPAPDHQPGRKRLQLPARPHRLRVEELKRGG